MLEEIYDVKWLKNNPAYAFLLGLAYAVIGIGGAILLFPDDPALISVAIISILLMPSLYQLSVIEEESEKSEGWFNLIDLLKKQKSAFKVYLFLFFGIFVTYAFFALFLPNLATNVLFQKQLAILSGKALFDSGIFIHIFFNNFRILMLCFVISLIAGNGAIFLITWNASVWGTIFGNLAKTSASAVGKDPWIYFALIILSVLPHLVLEITSYIISIISGSVISEASLKERIFSPQFNLILKYNLVLLVLGFVILVIAALVESYVLNNASTYSTIILQSFYK